MELTQELVKDLFEYHADGYLIRKIRTSNRINKGERAGYLQKNKTGYRYKLKILARNWSVSRIIFLYHHGYLPDIVDHENRNKLDDRIENLREANRSDNNSNTTSRKNSTSKYLGVWTTRITSKQILKNGTVVKYSNTYWKSCIRKNGKIYNIGLFKNETDAALAYNRAAVKHHGEFANLNIINP